MSAVKLGWQVVRAGFASNSARTAYSERSCPTAGSCCLLFFSTSLLYHSLPKLAMRSRTKVTDPAMARMIGMMFKRRRGISSTFMTPALLRAATPWTANLTKSITALFVLRNRWTLKITFVDLLNPPHIRTPRPTCLAIRCHCLTLTTGLLSPVLRRKCNAPVHRLNRLNQLLFLCCSSTTRSLSSMSKSHGSPDNRSKTNQCLA
mmetsp:Transcript_38066/g.59367  ORF Transcript_38066/g.59367 Transcript_38066/m.59367 type:complete len:205 (-) Transcript_38066:110-724(-)